MMGERQAAQEALFYEFSLERHVPADHWVRAIDRFVDLSEIRGHLLLFAAFAVSARSTRARACGHETRANARISSLKG